MLKSLLFSAALFVLAWSAEAGAQQKIKIGVSLPLTGPAATYGNDVRNAFLFANEKFAGGRYELVIEDDRCSPREAVNIAHKFIGVEKIKYVLGFACSGALLGAAPIYEKAGVLVMASLASSPSVSRAGDYIFRVRPSDGEMMKALAKLIEGRHGILGVLAEQTDYAQDTKAALMEALEGGSGRVVEDAFLSDTSDFRPVLMKLRAKGVEGLVIVTQSEQMGALLVGQIRDLGWPVQIYGSNVFISAAFVKLAGEKGDGIIAVSMPGLGQVLTPEGKVLYQEFLKKYGPLSSVDYDFYLGVESFRALQAALESGKNPKDFLYSNTFNGIFGPYSFDRNGDIQSLIKPATTLIRNGTLQPLP